jgi:hypothetical protein
MHAVARSSGGIEHQVGKDRSADVDNDALNLLTTGGEILDFEGATQVGARGHHACRRRIDGDFSGSAAGSVRREARQKTKERADKGEFRWHWGNPRRPQRCASEPRLRSSGCLPRELPVKRVAADSGI